MKMTKRIVAWILTLCMILPVIPFTAPAHAATAYRYELDTDGIDAGATYLIASASSGSVNLLKFHYSGMFNRDFQNQSGVSVSQKDGKQVIATGFTGEEDCTFVFSAATSGTISHGSYKVDLADSGFTSYSPDTLTFSHQGSGRYRITIPPGVRSAICVIPDPGQEAPPPPTYICSSWWSTIQALT